MSNVTYMDYDGTKIDKETFLKKRDDDVLIFGSAFYEVGTDFLQLKDPMAMMRYVK